LTPVGSDSRQVAEQSELVSETEPRGQHRRTAEAPPGHASDSNHIAGVDGRVAKRAKCEESHRRTKNDHTQHNFELSQRGCVQIPFLSQLTRGTQCYGDRIQGDVPAWRLISNRALVGSTGRSHTGLDSTQEATPRQTIITGKRPQLSRSGGDLVDDSEHQENEDQSSQGSARGLALRDIVELQHIPVSNSMSRKVAAIELTIWMYG
jgi:hypothetical protein